MAPRRNRDEDEQSEDFVQRNQRDEFERARRETMRQFKVTFMDGTDEVVFAHMHDGGGQCGAVGFITIAPDKSQRISHVFAPGTWKRIDEIVDPTKGTVLPFGTRRASTH